MKKKEKRDKEDCGFWRKELGFFLFMLLPKEKQALRALALAEKRPVHAIMLEAIQAHLNPEE